MNSNIYWFRVENNTSKGQTKEYLTYGNLNIMFSFVKFAKLLAKDEIN